MDPTVWGPHAWIYLHSITLAYPEEPTDTDKKNYKDFFTSIQYTLPCKKCQNHYVIHLQEDPVENHLHTKEQLVKWLINIHNKVNKINNKKELTYEEAINYFKSLYSLNKEQLFSGDTIINTNNNNQYLFYIFIILILILISYKIYKYNNT